MANPFTSVFEMQRQAWENAAEFAEQVGAIPEANKQIADIEVGQTPSEVVYEENKLKLLHYEARTDEQYDVPLLIVYALINRPYILDLQPNRSVVRTFLDHGFDVYLIDWGEPSRLDHALTFEDYVDRYMDNCVDVVRERSGQDAINLLGYCMGGTMSTMYAALYPEKVRNLGLMAAALCFQEEGGIIEQWIGDGYLDVETIADTFGTVPAEFLDAGFEMSDPVENTLTKYFRFFDNMDDEDFVRNFARMERWIDESIDIAGKTYVQFIEDTYDDQKLYKNEQYVGDKHADIDNLTMPIAQVVATYDHVVPPEASTSFNEVLPSDDVTVFRQNSGHIGLSVSSRAHADLWPRVCEWYAERSVTQEESTEEESIEEESIEEESAEEESTEAESTSDDPDIGDELDTEELEDTDVDSADDLEAIEGIGPTYAQRLREAGVADLEALVGADPDEIADEIDVSAERISDWAEQARNLTT